MKFIIPESKREVLRRVGNISQIAGMKRYRFTEGKEDGIEAVDVWTGTGFQYTVLPGRGMDIGWAGYKGLPISYISKAGLTGPAYFESYQKQWLRSFPGGMLSTCGLGNVGNPCEDVVPGIGMQQYGLHGRISNQHAADVCVHQFWEEDILRMEVSGTLTEAQLLGEHFSLRRTISSTMGDSCLHIHDEIVNEDFRPWPMMLMYHINFGYPVIDKESRVVLRGSDKFADDAESLLHFNESAILSEPACGTQENLYFYRTLEQEGYGFAGIVNEALEIAAYIRYSADTLPYITEWKMMGEADYVVGLEPGNSIPRGREYHRQKGTLCMMQAQSSITTDLEIGVVTGTEEIKKLLKKEGCQQNE